MKGTVFSERECEADYMTIIIIIIVMWLLLFAGWLAGSSWMNERRAVDILLGALLCCHKCLVVGLKIEMWKGSEKNWRSFHLTKVLIVIIQFMKKKGRRRLTRRQKTRYERGLKALRSFGRYCPALWTFIWIIMPFMV